MSTLADFVRARTDLSPADLAWLQRLVGEWQLVADLSFAPARRVSGGRRPGDGVGGTGLADSGS